jgi:hypothetical protein
MRRHGAADEKCRDASDRASAIITSDGIGEAMVLCEEFSQSSQVAEPPAGTAESLAGVVLESSEPEDRPTARGDERGGGA